VVKSTAWLSQVDALRTFSEPISRSESGRSFPSVSFEAAPRFVKFDG